VARTRPFAEPLSPRGPQPVVERIEGALKKSQWTDGFKNIGTGVLVLILLGMGETAAAGLFTIT
jgi:hypothetical protein